MTSGAAPPCVRFRDGARGLTAAPATGERVVPLSGRQIWDGTGHWIAIATLAAVVLEVLVSCGLRERKARPRRSRASAAA